MRAPLWGETFKVLAESKGTPLKEYYAKNYIVETYLVAEKVAIKLAALRLGVGALRCALGALLLFFLFFGLTVLTVDPTRNQATLEVEKYHPTSRCQKKLLAF